MVIYADLTVLTLYQYPMVKSEFVCKLPLHVECAEFRRAAFDGFASANQICPVVAPSTGASPVDDKERRGKAFTCGVHRTTAPPVIPVACAPLRFARMMLAVLSMPNTPPYRDICAPLSMLRLSP